MFRIKKTFKINALNMICGKFQNKRERKYMTITTNVKIHLKIK